MGLLDGEVAQAVYNGFKGKLLTLTLQIDVDPESPTKNALGDVTDAATSTYSCEGFKDEYSEFYKSQAGIPKTDAKVSIFAKSLPAGVKPVKDARVVVLGETWQIREVRTDPATALWECQSFRV